MLYPFHKVHSWICIGVTAGSKWVVPDALTLKLPPWWLYVCQLLELGTRFVTLLSRRHVMSQVLCHAAFQFWCNHMKVWHWEKNLGIPLIIHDTMNNYPKYMLIIWDTVKHQLVPSLACQISCISSRLLIPKHPSAELWHHADFQIKAYGWKISRLCLQCDRIIIIHKESLYLILKEPRIQLYAAWKIK